MPVSAMPGCPPYHQGVVHGAGLPSPSADSRRRGPGDAALHPLRDVDRGRVLRVVIGGRGPYIEFQTVWQSHMRVPAEELYRFNDPHVYYAEYRSHDKSD